MEVRRDGVHFAILEALCQMPRPVRGISAPMLERRFAAPWAVRDLAEAGLIRARGWHEGPGAIWVPTAAGEALHRRLAAEEAVARVDPPAR
ncbi:MAG TPA: hypothetical protein VFG47_20335 [Geminicoccaceae bacterium]|nr:hypothetical protein [Geminicoccaceae bacterium]